jgi:hypothetical protein
MRRIALILSLTILIQLTGSVAWAQNAVTPAGSAGAAAGAGADTSDELKQELEKLKKAVAALEERLKAQEKQTPTSGQAQAPAQAQTPVQAQSELVADVKELDKRVSQTERQQALDRLRFTGDFRFEAHSIAGQVPAHFDGMGLQNLAAMWWRRT